MTILVGKCLLLDLLKDRKMTQQELANKTKISKQDISDYVNNRKTMSLRTAKIIARSLRCHIDDLYEWIEIKE